MAFNWRAYATQMARKYNVPPSLFLALIRQESGGQHNVSSSAGAMGYTQLMPATAAGLGVDPRDPKQNIEGGAKYLSQQLRTFKDPKLALAAYNAGPGNVQKYGGVPPFDETQDYVRNVLRMQGEGSGAADRGFTPTSGGATPSATAAVTPPAASLTPKASATLSDDNPRSKKLLAALESAAANYKRTTAQPAAAPVANSGAAALQTAGGGGQSADGFKFKLGKQAGSYKDLIRLGQKFGLNIQGEFQTTGGNHSAGSYHYQDRAVDFGDATNSPQAMAAFAAYVKKNPQLFTEFYWGPGGFSVKDGKLIQGNIVGGHDDHIHVARNKPKNNGGY